MFSLTHGCCRLLRVGVLKLFDTAVEKKKRCMTSCQLFSLFCSFSVFSWYFSIETPSVLFLNNCFLLPSLSHSHHSFCPFQAHFPFAVCDFSIFLCILSPIHPDFRSHPESPPVSTPVILLHLSVLPLATEQHLLVNINRKQLRCCAHLSFSCQFLRKLNQTT